MIRDHQVTGPARTSAGVRVLHQARMLRQTQLKLMVDMRETVVVLGSGTGVSFRRGQFPDLMLLQTPHTESIFSGPSSTRTYTYRRLTRFLRIESD